MISLIDCLKTGKQSISAQIDIDGKAEYVEFERNDNGISYDSGRLVINDYNFRDKNNDSHASINYNGWFGNDSRFNLQGSIKGGINCVVIENSYNFSEIRNSFIREWTSGKFDYLILWEHNPQGGQLLLKAGGSLTYIELYSLMETALWPL